MIRYLAAALLCALSLPAHAAEEDKDLDLIPGAAPPPMQAEARPDPSKQSYLQDAFSAITRRGNLAVPYPSPQPGTVYRSPIAAG